MSRPTIYTLKAKQIGIQDLQNPDKAYTEG